MKKSIFLSDDVVDVVGTLTHYNGIVLGNLSAEQADCEGALAVGGMATLGSPGHGYDVGAAGVPAWESVVIGNYQNPNGYPSFLLGGTVSPSSTSSRVFTGPVVLKSDYQQQYESGSFRFDTSDLRYADDSDVDSFFVFARESFSHTGEVLFNGTSARITQSELGYLNTLNQTDYLSENIDTDKRILVYTVDCAEDAEISIADIGLGEYINDYDSIVINIPASKVTFKYGAILYDGSIVNTSVPKIYEGNQLIALIASKVVFNLPNAVEVSMEHYGIIGSVIAPSATVSGHGGSINGMLVAENLNQQNGMELHAFTLPMGEALLALEAKSDERSIIIQKTAEESGALLSGTQFELYEYDIDTGASKLILTGKTDEQGSLTFYPLAPAYYKLKETVPTLGYSLPEESEWIINTEKETQEMEIIYIQNALAKYEVKFLKFDCDNTDIKLADAEFSLYVYREQDQQYHLLKSELTTNVSGVLTIEELLSGQYRLLETSAPSGYYLPEDYAVDFEITLDGDVDVAEDGYVKICNQQLASVTLIKHDFEETEVMLAGAVFALYLYDDEAERYELVSSGHTTDHTGEVTISGLQPGSYKLVETAAPAGYYLESGSEVEFVVEVADKKLVPVPTLYASNKMLGKVQIYKIDSEEHDLFLAGAEFTLYKYNSTESEYEVYRTGIVSDFNGSVLIEGLEPGDYKLVETESPVGYSLPENPETLFTITL